MNRVTRISAWLAIGLCIVAAPAIFPGGAAAQSLDIRIKSDLGGPAPGDLMLTDPFGDRMGPEDMEINRRNPMSGLYNLQVNGWETGVYTLLLKAHSESGSTSDVRFPHMNINDGEVHHYDVIFATEGPKLEVRRTRITSEYQANR